jgi:murein DD-endopeptidase MepM/ murein hydrolase activator NlpD
LAEGLPLPPVLGLIGFSKRVSQSPAELVHSMIIRNYGIFKKMFSFRLLRNFLCRVISGCFFTFLLSSCASPLVKQGREYAEAFYANRFDLLWPHLSEEMKRGFGSEEGLIYFRKHIAAHFGQERQVLDEQVFASVPARRTLYSRRSDFSLAGNPIIMEWIWNSTEIVGFLIVDQNKIPSPLTDYRTRTQLELPFRGEWRVFWGGRNLVDNYHFAFYGQRFAYDFAVVKSGRSFQGNGRSNRDYYAFGKPVYAAGSGIVVEAVDGIADNDPGEVNSAQAAGNHVVIDHQNGEFSFTAHFQQGSVRVKLGQRVNRGDRLGLCGNSGQTTQPHVHFHLAKSSALNQNLSLPAQFRNYSSNGKNVEIGEPRRGETISRQ